MQDEQTWEPQLDVIADEIRGVLECEAPVSGREPNNMSGSTVRNWMAVLVDLLDGRQRENDVDGASEVLDVLALLLKSTADGHWLQRNERSSSGGAGGIFTTQLLDTVATALRSAMCDPFTVSGDQGDVQGQASEILASLLLLATCERDFQSVVGLLQAFNFQKILRPSAPSTSLARPSMMQAHWSEWYLHFAMRSIATEKEPTFDRRQLPTLQMLTGSHEATVAQWIQETWETKWHIHRSACVGKKLFGSSDACLAPIRNVLSGFSVGQSAAELPSSKLAAMMSLREAHTAFGLHHGVDITFIRAGQIHPRWRSALRTAIQLEDIDEAISDGYSVGVRGMQARCLPIFHLVDNLQKELGQHVNANLYWTPPRQQGFDLHVDDHCVFAIQLKGQKRWTLHEPLEQLPLLYEDTSLPLRAIAPAAEIAIVLEEGDVLYVPRGVAHFADTKDIDEESVHLTIGVEIEQAYTNSRLIEEALAELLPNSNFHLQLPERLGRAGLMEWHLSGIDALESHIRALCGSEHSRLMDKAGESLERIRGMLRTERHGFLSQRSMQAHAMATLHEVVCNEGAANIELRFDPSEVRSTKKQRL